MIDLSIEGKITIFKILVISKILHLGLITSAPAFIIKQLNIIKKYIWQGKKTQIKHSALQNIDQLVSLRAKVTF